MPNPLENKMLLYYLSGLGGAIGGEGSVGAALGGMTQQQIQSQNFMKMMQQMLGGLPAGAKMTGDKDAFTMKMPVGAAEGAQAPGAPTGTGTLGGLAGTGLPSQVPKEAGGSGIDWASPENFAKIKHLFGDTANPFASPLDVSGADLVGLTPKDISQALQTRMGFEQLGQKRITDLVDMLYKRAQIGKITAKTEAERPIYSVPGTDIKLSADQFIKWKNMTQSEKTAGIKNFEYAQAKGFTGDFMQFQDSARTTHQKDFDAAVEGGYTGSFNEWMLSMAKAGAINLGEFAERKKVGAEVSTEEYFTSPKLSTDVDKYISDPTQWAKWSGADNPEREKAKMTAGFVRKKVTAAGGKIVDVKMDGRTMVWTVKWKSGRTGEVRYAF